MIALRYFKFRFVSAALLVILDADVVKIVELAVYLVSYVLLGGIGGCRVSVYQLTDIVSHGDVR